MNESIGILDKKVIDSRIANQIPRLVQLSIQEVMELKKLIEDELIAHVSDLESHGVDLETPLVTDDGFPRADIDVYQIRHLRRNINMLQNDLAEVLARAHILLSEHFERGISSRNDLGVESRSASFAIFYEVNRGGPIGQAGIRDMDRLIAMDDIDASNHQKLTSISRHVAANEGKKIRVYIDRDGKRLEFTVIPSRNWPGKGLLGCRLREHE